MLEIIFYSLGIITMTLLLIMFLMIIALYIRVRSSIVSFKEGFAGKIVRLLKERNIEVASALGLTFAHFVMDKMRHIFNDKKSKRN